MKDFNYPDPQMEEAIAKTVKLAQQNDWSLPLEAIEHLLLEYGFEGDRLAEFQGRLKVVVDFALWLA